MPVAYRIGTIKSAIFLGAGKLIAGETVMDGRTIDEIILQNGRAYFATNDGAQPHIIGSLPAGPSQMGKVLRNEPTVTSTDSVEGGESSDTVTGA